MRKGLLSFAVATFAMLVLFYLVAVTYSLRDNMAIGQKRLEAQLVSQRHADAIDAYNRTILDAITDAAYASKYTGSCRGASTNAEFSDELRNRMEAYLNETTRRLSAENYRVAYGYNTTQRVLINTASPRLIRLTDSSPCGTGALFYMNLVSTEVAIKLNVTYAGGESGFVNEVFNQTYDVFMNYTDAPAKFIIKISAYQNPDSNVNCVEVAC